MESLYQKKLLTLASSARDLPTLKNPTHVSVVNNPICGDKVTATIEIDNHIIIANAVEARGCALCEAGAGLWMHMAANRPLLELSLLHDQLASWLRGKVDGVRNTGIDITPLTPVRAIKNRHKCVLLAFSTADKFRPL